MDGPRFDEPDYVEQARQRMREKKRRHAEGNGHVAEPLPDENRDFYNRPRPPEPPDEQPPPLQGDEPEPHVNGDGQKSASQKAQKAKSSNFPAIKRCSELQAVDESLKWLLAGCMARRSTTLFSALWKAGKTTFISYLLRAFGREKRFCGMEVSQAKVLYVTEESEGRWAERRDELGLGDHVSFLVRPFKG